VLTKEVTTPTYNADQNAASPLFFRAAFTITSYEEAPMWSLVDGGVAKYYYFVSNQIYQ
jgi:hypothetical protein